MKERQSGLGNDEKILMLHKEYQKLDKKLEDIARTVEQNQLEDCFFQYSDNQNVVIQKVTRKTSYNIDQ